MVVVDSRFCSLCGWVVMIVFVCSLLFGMVFDELCLFAFVSSSCFHAVDWIVVSVFCFFPGWLMRGILWCL